MLIFMSLQLVPATFSIFYHYALGKTSVKKADDRSLSFVLGSEIFSAFVWVIVYTLLFTFFCTASEFCPSIIFWIMSGVLIAEAVLMLFFYYRKGNATALFISRRTAKALCNYSCKAKNRSDAIAVGFFAGFPELIFTLPLYIISAIILLDATTLPRTLIILLLILAGVIPLFIIRTFYRTSHNLASITRLRIRIKPFVRFIIPLLYLFLAIAVLNLGVVNYG